MILIVAAAIVPSAFTDTSPLDTDIEDPLQGPSAMHLFGTDASGRDIYTRVIYGARDSLAIGIGATVLALLVAIALGLAAGLGGLPA